MNKEGGVFHFRLGPHWGEIRLSPHPVLTRESNPGPAPCEAVALTTPPLGRRHKIISSSIGGVVRLG